MNRDVESFLSSFKKWRKKRNVAASKFFGTPMEDPEFAIIETGDVKYGGAAKVIPEAAKFIANQIVHERLKIELQNARRTDSPIEILMFLALPIVGRERIGCVQYSYIGINGEEVLSGDMTSFQRLVIEPQYKVKNKRADFRVEFSLDLPVSDAVKLEKMEGEVFETTNPEELLIECDSKKHHSTPEELANDRFKEILFKGDKFKLMRFSGSEITRDAFGCADEIVNYFIGD